MRPMFNPNLPSGVPPPPPPPDPFSTSPFSSPFRRQTPYFGQPDYRIYEMNKRLQQRTEVNLIIITLYIVQRVVLIDVILLLFVIAVFHESKTFTLKNHFKLFVNQESDNLWWDAFATEFFEDDATLTLTFCLEDGPKRYSKQST